MRFEVSDTGIGIEAADHLRLLDSFSQADASTTRRYGGTGLGLAICRRLTEVMGGEIGLTSTLGEGSTFWFSIRFPLAKEDPARTPDPPVPGLLTGLRVLVVDDNATNRFVLESQQLSGPASALARPQRPERPSRGRILVVEDNEVNQLVACEMVAKLGYQAEVAVDGAEAVSAIAARSYAAVLMDCHMPVMDGFEATRTIRARGSHSAQLPIIAMTAGAQDEDRERCLAAGMDDYLSKPVDLAALDEALKRWVPRGLLPKLRRRLLIRSALRFSANWVRRTGVGSCPQLPEPSGAGSPPAWLTFIRHLRLAAGTRSNKRPTNSKAQQPISGPWVLPPCAKS